MPPPIAIPTLIMAATALVAALTTRGSTLAVATYGSAFALVGAVAVAAIGVGERDGLSLVMNILIAFVATIVFGFSRRFMRADLHKTRYAASAAAMVACVLTFVSAQDIAVFLLAWMGSGVLLALLIGHRHTWDEARDARRRALIAFAVGDTALVAALGFAHAQTGASTLSGLADGVAALPAAPATAIAIGLLVAAAARAALPPFASWLLGSMTAPTPISALMHAGLVNAGGFLLIRFAPVLEAAPIARALAVVLGMIAALWGTLVMTVRADVKRSLGGSTVAQMGFMIMTCGLGAYAAALWHLVSHSAFKAWLFLRSGSEIGERPATQVAPAGASVVLAAGVAAVAAAYLWSHQAPASAALAPLLLAAASGVTGAAMLARARAHAAPLGLAMIGFALAYAGGLALMRSALARPEAPSTLPVEGALLVALPFLALWAWQARRTPLGPRAYAALLNAGVRA